MAVAGGYDPSDDQPVLRAIPLIRQYARNFTFSRDGKQRLQFRAVGPGAHHFRRGPAAQNQVDGIDDDGFAGPGFAGQDGEPPLELHTEVIDDGKIFYGEFEEHGVEIRIYFVSGQL